MSNDKRIPYIVGSNIEKASAYYHLKKGHIKRYAEGIYYDSDLTAQQAKNLVGAHINRIIKTRMPDAVMVGGSAISSGQYNGVVMLHADKKVVRPYYIGDFRVEFYHNRSGLVPSITTEYYDNIGYGTIRVALDEYNFLLACRRVNSPRRKLLIADDLLFLLRRIESKYSSKNELIEAIERQNEIYIKDGFALKRALEIIDREYGHSPHSYDIRLNEEYFNVFLAGKKIGELICDRANSIYRQKKGIAEISLAEQKIYGTIPYFMESLITETWMDREKKYVPGLNEVENADRYLSNIVIRKSNVFKDIVVDYLDTRLRDIVGKDGVIANMSAQIVPKDTQNAYREIFDICSNRDATRMSGAQPKIPINISGNVITPAIGKPCTHIMKLPGVGIYSTSVAIEWYSMSVARSVGLKTEDFAICEIENIGLTFIAERFDIRKTIDSEEVLLMEDFCSIMGNRNHEKYYGDMLGVAKMLLKHSTNVYEDARSLFKQTLFSWIICNNDMHLKNLALIKNMYPDMSGYSNIELSPAYDILCTGIYPVGPRDKAALSIGGEHTYGEKEFLALAKTLGIPKNEAILIMKEMVKNVRSHLDRPSFEIPELILKDEASVALIHEVDQIMERACNSMEIMIGNVNKHSTKSKFRR